MNRLLLISAAYPPMKKVGAFRAGKFTKHLPQNNWKCHILTSKFTGELDNTHFDESIEQAESVHRIRNLSNSIKVNELGVSWIPDLVWKAKKIIDENGIDIIFHTGGPFTPMLGSYSLNKTLNVPYVLDLRDPWTLRQEYILDENKSFSTTIHQNIASRLEPLVFQSASTVIMNTHIMESEYRQKYPRMTSNFTTITNGFDSEKFPACSIQPATSNFQIVYPGKFYGDLKPLFQSLSILFTKYVNAQFVHLGNPDKQVQKLTNRYGIQENVQFRGYVERDEVIETLQQSDLGLALGRDITHIPMKVYDYMGCNLPILAMGPPRGALCDIVGDFEGGYAVDRTDPDQIESALFEIYESRPERLATPEALEPYKVENLTAKLATVLDEAIQS